MSCSVCKIDKKTIDHHLSYDPEIVVRVCYNCHFAMHALAKIPQEQRNIINEWIAQYGHQWKDGAEKHHKSEHYRIKNLECSKNYQSKHYDIKEITKRIEKMEKLVKFIKP